MTSMPHLAAIAWDHADRMQHCDLGGGGDVWFVYDAAGERVRKVQVNASASTVRERVYLGGYEVYRERAANSAAPEVERQTLHVGDDRGKLALVETLTVDGHKPMKKHESAYQDDEFSVPEPVGLVVHTGIRNRRASSSSGDPTASVCRHACCRHPGQDSSS